MTQSKLIEDLAEARAILFIIEKAANDDPDYIALTSYDLTTLEGFKMFVRAYCEVASKRY